MMRVLFAKAIDEVRTAIVIDMGNEQLFGGVVFLTDFKINMRWHPAYPGDMDLRFKWEWYKVIDNADAFSDNREWEKQPQQIGDVKQLEGPRGMALR